MPQQPPNDSTRWGGLKRLAKSGHNMNLVAEKESLWVNHLENDT
jgi:hypothetical protein